MKQMYERRAADQGVATSPDHADWTQQWVYLSLWYATLYVVIEGWRDLKLSNGDIQRLLMDSTKVNALGRFRNGAFHFQKKYFDNRFTDFVALGESSADWARRLHTAFGRWFLERMDT